MKRFLGWAMFMLLVPAAAQAACTLSAKGLAFGLYNPLSMSPTDTASTVEVHCTRDAIVADYVIELSIGSGGSYLRRTMTSGRSTLPYQIYSDPARSKIWGDGTGGSTIVTGTSLGAAHYDLYGRIPARFTVSPGTYSDVIVVTVSF